MAGNPPTNNDLTWRSLNREGCEMGRSTKREVLTLAENVNKVQAKLDKILWALIVAALGLTVSAVGLLLNLAA